MISDPQRDCRVSDGAAKANVALINTLNEARVDLGLSS